jgi:hypothetical protein
MIAAGSLNYGLIQSRTIYSLSFTSNTRRTVLSKANITRTQETYGKVEQQAEVSDAVVDQESASRPNSIRHRM